MPSRQPDGGITPSPFNLTAGGRDWRSRTGWSALLFGLLSLVCPCLRGGQTVVDAGSAFTFTVPAQAANYAWRLEGTLVSTNGIVGTNGPAFTYAPGWPEVGTHELTCYQTLSNGVASNIFWQVRVRIPQPASATFYYVATNGSDTNPGTLAAPFLTLEQARNTVRALPRPLPVGGVTVWLRGGTYWRTNTFALASQDSGTMSSPIVYASYPGETAVISAGTPIRASAFVPLNSSQTNRLPPGINPASIWELDLAAAGIAHRGPFPAHIGTWVTLNTYSPGSSGGICDLFYNDQRMWLARYPNHSLTNDNLGTPYSLMDGVATTGPGSTNYLNNPGIYTNSAGVAVPVGCAFHYYSSNATEVARWQSALTNGGVWVSGFWRVDWQNDAVQVLGIDLTNQVIEITNALSVQGGIGYKYNQPLGSLAERYWVMNLLEDMNQPGEWAIDFKRGKIYFYAPGTLTDGSVVLADFAAPVVQLTQTTNVVLQSLTIEDGLAQGILVTNGVNNLILGCTLQNMNNYPVDLNGGYTNGVLDCLLQNLGGGGVLLHGGNASSSPRVAAGNFVVNNLITNSGVIARVYNTPVDMGGNGAGSSGTNVVGMRVAHNLLTAMPHLGILHGTTWDARIEYNELANFGQISSGIGGIYGYTYYASSGNNYFRYNYVHDSPLEDGITFDQDHRQAHVYCNLVNLTVPRTGEQQCFATETGSQATAGEQQYLDHYNNLGLNSNEGLVVVSPVGSTIEENAMFHCTTAYTWQQVVIGVASNTFTAATAASLQSGPNLTYTNDPGFLNLAAADLRLAPTSPIYSDMPRFTPLPVEMMGLYNDEIRTNAPGYGPYVTTEPATALGPGTATVNGTLVFPQFDLNTFVFLGWGTNDGGTNMSAWSNLTPLGLRGAGALSTNLSGLANQSYYYRFFATNQYGQAWAATAASFTPYSPGHIPASLVWRGDGSNNVWDAQDTNHPLWLATGQTAAFWDGDAVTFDDAGSNVPAINLSTTVQPASLVCQATQTYTLGGSGKISGVTSLAKAGPGTLIILTTNDYTGSTWINQGTLQLGNGGISGSLGTGAITNNAVLRFNQSSYVTLSGIIAGTGTVVNAGSGTLTLGANNTYTGGTIISGGAVAIAADANLGTPGGTLVLDGGTLQITSGGLFSLNNRPVRLNTNGGVFNLANTLTITNAITGPGSLTLNNGTLVLAANNQYAGTTLLNGGVLQVDDGTGSGSIPGNILLAGGNLLFARPDAFTPAGVIAGNGTTSAINNTGGSGRLTLTFAAGGGSTNYFNTIFNCASNVLTLSGGTTVLPNLGTDLRNLGANETLLLTNGYWFTPRIGGNGGPYMLGTNIIANATLETSGARGVKGIWQIQNGATLRLNSTRYAGAINENRFDFGNGGMSAGETASITIFPGGTLDIWALQYDGLALGQNIAGGTATIWQNGGTALVGVNGGSGNQNLLFNAAGTNGLTGYFLNAGVLKIAGTVSANPPAAGGTNLFAFTGGTLTVYTFNPTNLWGQPTNTLINTGGCLAPGGQGIPGRTLIQGNYLCSNTTSLAIDLGGPNPATAFTNAANFFDTVAVSGNATVNGSLAVTLINNWVPTATNSFTLLTAGGTVNGGFTNVLNHRVPVAGVNGASFQVVTTTSSVTLTNFQIILASFLPGATNVPAPLTVVFSDTSVGAITNRNWNFGDGQMVNTIATTVNHAYASPGSYVVTLTVSGPAGTNAATVSLQVVASPVIKTVQVVNRLLVLSGTNGPAGGNYRVLASPNPALPLTNWTTLATNQFSNGGGFNFTNALPWTNGSAFFLLSVP